MSVATIGWVYGRDGDDCRETLTSYHGWFCSCPGEEWVHPELDPETWVNWCYARCANGKTSQIGPVEQLGGAA
jgi:hypothetical protein